MDLLTGESAMNNTVTFYAGYQPLLVSPPYDMALAYILVIGIMYLARCAARAGLRGGRPAGAARRSSARTRRARAPPPARRSFTAILRGVGKNHERKSVNESVRSALVFTDSVYPFSVTVLGSWDHSARHGRARRRALAPPQQRADQQRRRTQVQAAPPAPPAGTSTRSSAFSGASRTASSS
jgi:hypothetical protein